MNVTVVGTGYVGLVTGACLADLGHEVTCLDISTERIAALQAGKMPFYEPGLDALVGRQAEAGRLLFATRYEDAVPGAEAIFICVGTPSLADGRADTSGVAAAAEAIGRHLTGQYCVLINKSTVPIGSGDWVGQLVRQGVAQRVREVPADMALSAGSGRGGTAVAEPPVRPAATLSFDVVSNPEFLREGTAIDDAFRPDRIVVGVDSGRAAETMRRLYAPLLERCARQSHVVPFIETDRASAEMIKYAANAFLATKISFINEIANICERVGADVSQVAEGLGLDHRIGSAFLNAGIGWGGSCFPKDLASLISTAQEYGYPAPLLRATQEVNTLQRQSIVRRLQDRLKLIKGKRIAVWGLAFKPGTDDLRDAPALTIIDRLADLGAEVRAYDPQALAAARQRQVKADLFSDPYECARDADAVLLVTEWPEVLDLDWSRLGGLMRRSLVIDGRNALDRHVMASYGFEYWGIGC